MVWSSPTASHGMQSPFSEATSGGREGDSEVAKSIHESDGMAGYGNDDCGGYSESTVYEGMWWGMNHNKEWGMRNEEWILNDGYWYLVDIIIMLL